MRRLATVIAITGAAAFGAIVIGGTANAVSTSAEYLGTIKRATTSYSSPSKDSIPVHFNLLPGQKANVVCWTEGQNIDNNTTWFRIGQDGHLGFVHRDVIAPPQYAPHC